jgi:hypothetical protein
MELPNGEPMKAIGRVQLTTVELQDSLEISVVREYGRLEWAIGLVLTLFTIWLFWRFNTPITHLFAAVICAVAATAVIAIWVQGTSTKLRVTRDEILAEGNINKIFSNEMRIPVSEVKWLGYEAGGENEPSGLYLRRGWSRTCLLPGLDEDQGIAVVSAIFAKFPEIVPEDKRGGSLLYGSESGLTGLGLSDRESEKPKAGE